MDYYRAAILAGLTGTVANDLGVDGTRDAVIQLVVEFRERVL